MNKARSHLHMFEPRRQQCFSHWIYSSNQISSVHFLLDSFPSFNWIPAQKLETVQRGPVGLPFFFNQPDSSSPPITSLPLPHHHLPFPLQFRAINDVVSLATTTTSGARAPHSGLL
jgi:hypothetical protein